MASSYSIQHNYDQPLYTPDFQLITTALTMKTEKLNLNRQKLQNLRDQFGALDVMKDVDANYLENRLQQVTELTNQYAGGDLSDDGLARSLQANLSQVIDDNVKNAVLSTKLRRAENAEWDKMKVDKQELYSDLNRAYASQNAQVWAANEQVGAVYKGGGGFKAFDDIDKRMLKELPEVIKTLKDTWQETVPGSGMFYDIVTKEAVPRHEVENAMNMVIGQKGAEQMRINAWGANQGKAPEQLKQEYDEYFAPKIQSMDNEISKAQNTLVTDKTLTANDKIQIQQSIERMQANRDNMLGNSFDKVAAVDGVAAAYTTLYTQKYKNGILDTYSYAPRIIDRKIDENHKATIDFKHKLEREAVTDDQWKKEHALKMAKDYREQKEFEAEFAVDPITGKVKTEGDITQGKTQLQESPSIEQALVRKQEEETQAIMGMKETIKSITGKTLTSGQLLQLQGQLDLGKAINDVVIDGGKFQIDTKKHFKSLLAFQNKILNQSDTEVSMHKTIEATADKITWQLSKMAAADKADFTPSELFNYQFMFVKDKSGKIVKTTTPQGSHTFAELLRKNGATPNQMTEEEKLTLKTYVNYSLAVDPKTSPSVATEVMNNMRRNVWAGVPTSATNGLPTTYGAVKKETTNALEGTTGIKKGGIVASLPGVAETFKPKDSFMILDVEETPSPGKMKQTGFDYSKPASKSIFADRYLSDLAANDMEYVDEDGEEVSFKGINTQLEEQFNIGFLGAESELGQDYKLFKSNELIFAGNKDLERLTGAPPKTPITVVVDYNSEGKLTGKVDWYYYSGTGEKRVKIENENNDIDIDLLRKNNIPFRNVNRTMYMAQREGAPSIDLGKGYDGQEMMDIRLQYDKEDSPFVTDKYLPQLITEMEKYGQADKIVNYVKSYVNGDYSFKLEPYGGTYRRSMYKGETLVRRYDTKETTYEEDEVQGIYNNALIDNNLIFYKFLQEKAEELKRVGGYLNNDLDE